MDDHTQITSSTSILMSIERPEKLPKPYSQVRPWWNNGVSYQRLYMKQIMVQEKETLQGLNLVIEDL